MARTRAGVASSPAPASWPQSLAKSWQVEVGIGYSTPVVQGERVFQLSRQGENEVVRALKISTGATLWEHSYDAPYIMNPAAASHGKGPNQHRSFPSGPHTGWNSRQGRIETRSLEARALTRSQPCVLFCLRVSIARFADSA